MAFFDIYMSPPQQDGKVSIHPRLVSPPRSDSERLKRETSQSSSLTEGDMSGALSAVSEFLRRQLAAGGSVNLDGIGTFRVVPHFKSPKHAGDKVTGKDVEVKRIHFTPSRQLTFDVKRDIVFDRREAPHSREMNETQAVLLLRQYFQDHDYITVREFEREAHVNYTQARTLLNGLVKKEHLLPKRLGRMLLYHANRYHYPTT